MTKVIFETPTTLDLNALTVFGLSAKPCSINPIGYFGTGLKYAMAILAREGCGVELFIGNDKYKLRVSDAGFRGKIFHSIELVGDKKTIQLPFTTELGKNWELWQAFRELYCNTLDESGTTYIDNNIEPIENKTIITVENEEFVEIFEDRFNQVFLEDADTFSIDGVQIIAKESEYIYFRGVRVMKTDKPCLNTYNILSHVTLTEDRTAAYEWSVKDTIQEALKLEENKEVLENALNSSDTYWENSFDYYMESNSDISEAFKEVGSSSSNQKVKRDVYKTTDEYKQAQREEEEAKKKQHFSSKLIYFLENDLELDFTELAYINKEELITILKDHLEYV